MPAGSLLRWSALAGATVGEGAVLTLAGVPSPYLFAALVLGLAAALTRPGTFALPPPAFLAAQAVLGVVLGAYLTTSSLRAVAASWLPVALVSAATLAVCIGVGLALARCARVDPATSTLGMVAGGASGIVAMADELGADDRLVAFMQYARVLLVVLVTPLLAALLFPGAHGAAGGAPDPPLLGSGKDWLITLVVAPVGVGLGRAVRLPAGTLLGPLAIAGALALARPFGAFAVPALLQQAAFILIGLQVGLRFTVSTVKEVGRLLVPVLLCIVALMVVCFGLAVLLDLMTPVSLLDAYLATTPGGLYAVVAVAFGAGANTTFILAVQSVRLLVMVLLAPVVVRRLSAGRS
ncbi:MAG: AbrB family transcriptional regulator [Solirubrobacteraceae bacterium]